MAPLLLVLTTLFWSGNFVLARAMHVEIPPLSLAFLRWSLAFVLMAPWVLPALWRERQTIRANGGILLLLAVLGVANFNTFVYLGVQQTSATNATLMQSAIPVVILLLSALLGQRVRLAQLCGIALSLGGVLLIVSRGAWDTLTTLAVNPGDLWILAAVVTWSLYTVSLRWRPQALSGLALLGVTVGIGALLLLPLYLVELISGARIQWSNAALLTIGYVALFPSVLAYFFWNYGVSRLGASRAGLFIHLMPVFGLLLSVLFLGERVMAFHLYGIALIFAGIYLATGRQSRGLQPDGDT